MIQNCRSSYSALALARACGGVPRLLFETRKTIESAIDFFEIYEVVANEIVQHTLERLNEHFDQVAGIRLHFMQAADADLLILELANLVSQDVLRAEALHRHYCWQLYSLRDSGPQVHFGRLIGSSHKFRRPRSIRTGKPGS
jgi:hypothetical protein